MTAPETGPERVHVVCTSHWDREWYLTAERFRFRLVQTIDSVLELLEQYPHYTFSLDGQSIVLEDYLQIRPEREAELREHLASGRLRAGPWYVQPDEFLVSAEALRRNLQLGSELVREMGGEPVMVGYVPDAFGHLANLPAILQSQGIDSAIFTRGTSAEVNALGDLFDWQAPGGETILAHREPIGYGMTLSAERTAATAQLERAVTALKAQANSPEMLLQLGSDHSRPQAGVPPLILDLGQPFVFSDHQQFTEAVKAANPKLKTYQGELRFGQFHPLLSGTLSARLYLKQRNYALDDRLRFSTEPLLALAQPFGQAPSAAYLRRAWKLLIQNHPHDSICGCSVDGVHDEMDVRSQQVGDIALELEQDALARLADSESAGKLLVFNPYGAAHLSGEVLLARHEIEAGTLTVGGQPVQLSQINSRKVSTLAGAVSSLPEWLEQLDDRHPVRFLKWQVQGDHLTAEVDEGARHPDCPPSDHLLQDAIKRGVKTVELQVFRTQAQIGVKLIDRAEQCALKLGFAVGEASMPANTLENESLQVSVDTNAGTLSVTELSSGRVWDGLHALVDVGDRGDSYTFSAVNDAPTRAKLVQAEVIESGPAYSRLELRYRLTIPLELTENRTQRSQDMTDIQITTEVTLWAGARHLEFKTTFTNTAKDHLLRVYFAGEGQGSHADSAEALLYRPEVLPNPQTADWADQPNDLHPLSHWAAKQGEGRYWGVASRGLSEYGHLNGLSITLVRSVGFLSRDDLPERPSQAGPPYVVPGAQCLRPIVAEYAWFAPAADLDTFNALALAYAHPARGWLVPAVAQSGE